jgi:hypothetical protein
VGRCHRKSSINKISSYGGQHEEHPTRALSAAGRSMSLDEIEAENKLLELIIEALELELQELEFELEDSAECPS